MQDSLKKIKLGLIGGGQMAQALITGILSKSLLEPEQIVVSDISDERLTLLKESFGVNTTKSNIEVAKKCNVLILAIKPQVIDQVLSELSKKVGAKHLVISIVAGVSLERLESSLKSGCRVIRVMPNTPALIQEAASALCKGKNATDEDLDLATLIFSNIGKAVIVPESMMDAVTGLSGSGPAYCFTFIEALIDAGVKQGLPRDIAQLLAVQTVIGSAKLIEETSKPPCVLKEMVTSPGGTTIAGLYKLERAGFRGIIMEAVEAATKRSKELGSK